jgi:thiosulfate/3-mercaptopyruvate sulfurtransferase
MTAPPHFPTPLIDAATLHGLMAAGTPLVLLDASFDLTDTAAGERAYAQAHLPGALYVHLDRDLSAPKTGRNGRHPLPSRETFAATAGRLGISPLTPVVVYDRQGSMFAARAWWMLRWLGHPLVAVLDGALNAWAETRLPLESSTVIPRGAPPYPQREPLVAMVDADTLQARLGKVRLIDARAPERFRGDVEPLDPVAGHIPGALNRPFTLNLGGNGRFKPAARLREEFAPLLAGRPPAETVHQCGSGATACHNLLAMEAAGLTGAALYPGSWSEWCADPARAVAKG